ncbi:carbohydrate kinase family protein [Alkalicoccobacillus plakortidis]|uniref:Carbohydrate kinase n=1 Tax=Alkalicoccobacillus plakortidis TaxID=444060 RepID=A0ABT0XMW3_9BACI|nr:carbohydrate kinase [Alkalicoccobacillus plakortidis]MCM2677239.1 carbohydrate kinase [Alkalicoccobacillus plakortidis]
MQKKQGIISLGEVLVDMIPLNAENTEYQKSPGGAPANVAVGLSRLGIDSYFIGAVGTDLIGHFLRKTLVEYGVNIQGLTQTALAKTPLVFVELAENGERSFEFLIDHSADQLLSTDDLAENLFQQAKILHIGSISTIQKTSRAATHKAIHLAQENGMLVSFDPNLRLSIWPDELSALEQIKALLLTSDIVKLSEEELEFLTNETDETAAVLKLKDYQIPLLIITKGEHGSSFYTNTHKVNVPTYKVEAVDTTGAGDAFVSGVLAHLHDLDDPLDSLTPETLQRIGAFAAVSGSLAASTKGAMTALPTKEEVEAILEERG